MGLLLPRSWSGHGPPSISTDPGTSPTARTYVVAAHPSENTGTDQLQKAAARILKWRDWIEEVLGSEFDIFKKIRGMKSEGKTVAEITCAVNFELAIYAYLEMDAEAAAILHELEPRNQDVVTTIEAVRSRLYEATTSTAKAKVFREFPIQREVIRQRLRDIGVKKGKRH